MRNAFIFENNVKTFNQFLEDEFTKTNPTVLDDDGPAALDHWYSTLDVDEVIKYGDRYGLECVLEITSGNPIPSIASLENEPNAIQKKLSDIVYDLSTDQIFYEKAYDKIVQAIKDQKEAYKNAGLIPTIELLITDLEEK